MERQSDLTYSHQQHANDQIDPRLLSCLLCNAIFNRPTTLTCGHSFCHRCLITSFSSATRLEEKSKTVGVIPQCPRCHSIIWRPLSALKENVTLSALVSKLKPRTNESSQVEMTLTKEEPSYRIMVECAANNQTILPHCFTQIIFTTAFIDEILEQQAQSNFIVVKWGEGRQGIAGRLMRPQIYHDSSISSRYQPAYKAMFEGKYFVIIKFECQLFQCTFLFKQQYTERQGHTAPINLCQVEELKPTGELSIEQLLPFFEVYDRLNNHIYLRQISQLVNIEVLQERTDPQKVLYCALRILRMEEKRVRELVECMDNLVCWEGIQEMLVEKAGSQPEDIIKIKNPGECSFSLVALILAILAIISYAAQ